MVVDPVGGPLREPSVEALAPMGRLVVAGNASGAEDVLVGANRLWLANAAVLGLNAGGLFAAAPELARAAADQARSLLRTGAVTADYTTLPLDQAVAAHERLESGGLTARQVLTT